MTYTKHTKIARQQPTKLFKSLFYCFGAKKAQQVQQVNSNSNIIQEKYENMQSKLDIMLISYNDLIERRKEYENIDGQYMPLLKNMLKQNVDDYNTSYFRAFYDFRRAHTEYEKSKIGMD